jgi:hypothetical protein
MTLEVSWLSLLIAPFYGYSIASRNKKNIALEECAASFCIIEVSSDLEPEETWSSSKTSVIFLFYTVLYPEEITITMQIVLD